ncbi:acyltransferase family protein [Falsihalocynthiibacter sp. S25ZX9]|uniref:acyltransferase family protein n=1 Tax=Falsihalocynthiibacter sp. S25ZX9 TaxID=3240870 RepID=UPI0035106AAB
MEARNNLPDIARGSLILLVVWGHLLESEGYGGSLYFAIYTFHIPAFAMISGMMSKSSMDARGLFKICRRLLVPLLIFQVVYFIALGYFAPERVTNFLSPVWIVWFLFSLFIWKLLLPLAVRLPYPLLLSVAFALGAGFIDEIGLEFGMSRTLVFFPAFIFGHLYGKRIFKAVPQYRVPLCILFVSIFLVAVFVSDYISIRLLWGSHPYSNLPLHTPGIGYRAVMIAVGIIASISFLAMLPTRSRPLALLGQETMPVYLLHGLPVMLFWAGGFQMDTSFLFLSVTALLSLVISFSIAISSMLSSRE